jgi:hypothetical protein
LRNILPVTGAAAGPAQPHKVESSSIRALMAASYTSLRPHSNTTGQAAKDLYFSGWGLLNFGASDIIWA